MEPKLSAWRRLLARRAAMSPRGRWLARVGVTLGITAAALAVGQATEASLETELGRSEVRIYSAPFELPVGRTVQEAALPERLTRLGYERVRGRRPERPGEYFWGHEVFRIYRHAHSLGGREWPSEEVAVALRRSDGMILGPHAEEGEGAARQMPWLEPEILAESLNGDRAPRIPIRLGDLPRQVWEPLLAIEDARFFDHSGVDYRGVARALLANAKAGKVTQGGSTITQQLIKMRDLTPKRSLGRKVSEAVRALALEAEYTKEEILQAYLNFVYYGHSGGQAVHGIGAASRAFFSKSPDKLSLAEAALLAGIIQGPNRLSPARHPEAAKKRRDRVLTRLEELEWATPQAVARAKRAPIRLRPDRGRRGGARDFLGWVAEIAKAEAPRWMGKGRGVVIETTLDAYLQAEAEAAVERRLDQLRSSRPSLRRAPLSAALVVLDAESGAVRAYVGGDPRSGRGGFDRARSAQRQPGSTVKPLVLLEAFDACGSRSPLHPASRVADEPVSIDLPAGPWKPRNDDGEFEGVIDVRRALADSRNVPFVRIGRWCGYQPTARRLRDAGLDLPDQAPPSLVLGAVEVTPLGLARAYTVFATPGKRVRPRPIARIARPGGRGLETFRPRAKRVVRPSTAYLVRDLMLEAAESGTAQAARIEGVEVAAKTGTSSSRRDAWFAGQAGGVVGVAWIGLDDDRPLGFSGAAAAGPLWRTVLEKAARGRPPYRTERPADIVEHYIDRRTGLLVRSWNPRAERALFRRGATPPRDRFFRSDEPIPTVR